MQRIHGPSPYAATEGSYFALLFFWPVESEEWCGCQTREAAQKRGEKDQRMLRWGDGGGSNVVGERRLVGVGDDEEEQREERQRKRDRVRERESEDKRDESD